MKSILRHISPQKIEKIDITKGISELNPGDSYWLNLKSDDKTEIIKYLQEFEVEKQVIKYVTEPQKFTRIQINKDALAVNIPLPLNDPFAPSEYLGLIVTRHRLVTTSNTNTDFLDNFEAEFYDNPFAFPVSLQFIIYMAISEILNSTMEHVLQLRKNLNEIMLKMTVKEDEIDLKEIVYLKNTVTYLSSIVEEQLYIIGFMPRLDWSQESKGVRVIDEIRSLSVSFEFLLSNLERQEDKLESLHDQYQSILQKKGNKRLGTLTIIQSIFVPLTLISGIYGMNFRNMPELEWHSGYFIVLSIMVVIALIEIWWFKRTGWFD